MDNLIEARIIGETSAGMTALEIHIDDELYWSIDYFDRGASTDWYNKALRQAYDDAEACGAVKEWAEWQYDDTNEPIVEAIDTGGTTWVVASFRPGRGWEFAPPRNDGQSWDFIKANRDRIPAAVTAAWENFMG